MLYQAPRFLRCYIDDKNSFRAEDIVGKHSSHRNKRETERYDQTRSRLLRRMNCSRLCQNLGGHQSRRRRRRCNIGKKTYWETTIGPQCEVRFSRAINRQDFLVFYDTRAAVAKVTVYDLNISEIPGEAFPRPTRALSLFRLYRRRKVRLSVYLFSIGEEPRARRKFCLRTNPGSKTNHGGEILE